MIKNRSKTERVGKHKTVVYKDEGWTFVVYHTTAVVRFNENWICLNTGGWDTQTTKLRMNQTSNEYNLEYHVHQKQHTFFITMGDRCVPFGTKAFIDRGTGEIITDSEYIEEERERYNKLVKEIYGG
jgi:hypothetical protein